MLGFARIQILGRVGKDPTVHTSESGGKIASFPIATNRGKRGEETTFWHSVKVYNPKLIETLIQYIHKGDLIHVEGDLLVESYTAKDNTQRALAVVEIRYSGAIDLLPRGTTATPQTAPQTQNAQGQWRAPAADPTRGMPGPTHNRVPSPPSPQALPDGPWDA